MKRPSILLLLCALPLIAQAQQVYRWVDASGVVHFSQTPPSEGPYENVTSSLPQSTTYNADGSVGKPAAKPGQKDAAGADQAATQAKADDAERCAKARERISYMEEKTAHRLMVTGPDGGPSRMTDEQFNAEIADAKSAADKYCQ
jgi:hypothetical protein